MPIVSVSQINNYIKRYIDQNKHLTDLWVKGEISNFKRHYSGHMYFTLKDSSSTLKVVMFQGYSSKVKFNPKDGMNIVAYGKVSVYEAGGSYQLYVESMIPDGIGELYASYEQLKSRLEAQGLFSVEKKKPLPKFPHTIGVISSISGAALRDVLNVISRRYPICHIIIYPAKVQGIGSADSICNGLEYFSKHNECDVIILARGGGSIEDLWAFNEEKTAHAIYDCEIPVITGVGHETDFTISDFVADMRAPTPSAAAEIAVPDLEKIRDLLNHTISNADIFIDKYIKNYQHIIEKHDIHAISSRLNINIELQKNKVEHILTRIDTVFNSKLTHLLNSVTSIKTGIDALNPRNVLKRGYTIVQTSDGKLADFTKLSDNDEIDVMFDGGNAKCIIRGIVYEQ